MPGNGAAEISILTSTQQRFLQAFFETQTSSDSFYLSGGTALAGYYLEHRYSDDLDFFTRDRVNLEPHAHREQLQRAVESSGLDIERTIRRGDHLQYALSGDAEPEHPLVKVEFVVDSPPWPASPRRFDNTFHAFVDDMLSIAVNKVTALGRREPKDYVDLYQIVRGGPYDLAALISLAEQKDPGLSVLTLALDFDDVVTLSNAARFLQRYMLKPVVWDDLVRFYEQWAHRLRELLPPKRLESPG